MNEQLINGLILLWGIWWMWLTIAFMEDDLKPRIYRRK